MVERYKPSAEEISDLVKETGNRIEKEVTTIEHGDGTPCVTIINLPSENAAVIHEHGSGMTYLESAEEDD